MGLWMCIGKLVISIYLVGNLNLLAYAQGVHLHLIYVYTCENPLFNRGRGGIYLPSLNIFYHTSS
jgi:hypothetical protein